MSEPSTGTWKDDPVALLGLGVLDSTVNSNSLNHVKIGHRLDNGGIMGNLSRTAQRIEAASALGYPSGMGVTSGRDW